MTAPATTDLHIVELMSHGLTQAEVARRLGYAEKTVRNRLTTVYRNLGAASACHAYHRCLAEGYLPVPDNHDEVIL